jgi:hypothetical protein
LTTSAAELRALPAQRIVRALGDAAHRWCAADFPPRVRVTAALEARLGYSGPVVEFALDRLFEAVTAEALEATIVSELGSLESLDAFVARPGRTRAHARGLERVVIISSESTIGVALAPLLFALCSKSAVMVKDRFDGLMAAFLGTLAEEEPALAKAAEAGQWAGGDPAVEDALFADADCVVAFGGPQALQAIRAHVPVEARFIPFGHRASLGYVAREALCDEDVAHAWAVRAAADAMLYDGESCMSAHALVVENGGTVSPLRFAELVAEAAEAVEAEFPASATSAEREARVASYRNLGAFRTATGRGSLLAAGTTTIAFDPPFAAPPAFLPRVVGVLPVDGPADALRYVQNHRLPLEAIGTTAPMRDEVRAFVTASGAARVTTLGALQRPPLPRNHGGRARIADFIRWIDDET